MDLEYYHHDYTLLGLIGLKCRLEALIEEVKEDIDEREQADEAAYGQEVEEA